MPPRLLTLAKNLTIIINKFFTQMLEILANRDGTRLKFASDALLAFFLARDDWTLNVGYVVRTMSQFQLRNQATEEAVYRSPARIW